MTRYIGVRSYEDAKSTAHEHAVADQRFFKRLRSLSDTERKGIADAVVVTGRKRVTGYNEAKEALKTIQTDIFMSRYLGTRLAGAGVVDNLMPLFDRWKVKSTNPVAHKHTMLYLTRFAAFTGPLQPREIKREHVVGFRDELEAQPKMTRVNVSKHLDALHADCARVVVVRFLVATEATMDTSSMIVDFKTGRAMSDVMAAFKEAEAHLHESADFVVTLDDVHDYARSLMVYRREDDSLAVRKRRTAALSMLRNRKAECLAQYRPMFVGGQGRATCFDCAH